MGGRYAVKDNREIPDTLDARTERFTNHEAANKYLQYKYRAGYQLG